MNIGKTCLALLCSAFGAIPGIVICFIGGTFNQFASILCVTAAMGVFFVYIKLCEWLNNDGGKPGIAGCIIICTAATYVSAHCVCAGQVYGILREAGNPQPIPDCILHLYDYLGTLELWSAFFVAVILSFAIYLIFLIKMIKH